MSVNFFLVDCNLLTPVVTLGAFLAVIVSFYGLARLASDRATSFRGSHVRGQV